MYNKITLFFIAFTCVMMSVAQDAPMNAPVVIKGTILNSTNRTVVLSSSNGKELISFCSDTLKEDGTFLMNCNLPSKDIFYLTFDGNKNMNVILQINDTIIINSDATNYIETMEIKGSVPSAAIWEYGVKYSAYKAKLDSATRYLKTHPGSDRAVNQGFAKTSTTWMSFRNDYIKKFANSPALIACMNGVDDAQEPELRLQLLEKLTQIYTGTPTGNNLNGLYQKSKAKWDKTKTTAEGALAQDIEMADTKGTIRKLSDLRGKVVLLDFWASWCGPCRKENPNVVKLYHKYKEKGFTVFSVSLDQNKAKWIAAIAKDGLVWPDHVSDLQGWRNAASQKYGVGSIPTTYLLDAEGKIVGKNLRGFSLEQKLKAIYGF